MPKQTFFNLNKEKRNKITTAAIDEFADKVYEQVNLSDVIKKAEIPRGSFYQYFNDKKDLYLHLLNLAKEKKMNYLNDSFYSKDLPFLELIEQLYSQGVQFAIDYPKFVRIFEKLLNNKNAIYDEVMKENLQFATRYYATCIDRDKSNNLISKNIDTQTLADLVGALTTNITLEHINTNDLDNSYKLMKERFGHIIQILKKGIEEK
ncbi:MAG TPA: TetR/AcrR family transcriptional regulator [Candidatus Izemoplasmatales bacterium]|nr:TetR/AcrR family transcriptional regulator [Candidatus Izemoplasmatales bacterium]